MTGCFIGVGSLDFSEFWHSARNPYEVVHGNFLIETLLKSHFGIGVLT